MNGTIYERVESSCSLPVFTAGRRGRPVVLSTSQTAENAFSIYSGASSDLDDSKCAQDACNELLRRSDGQMPDFLLVSATHEVDAKSLLKALHDRVPTACIQAVSSLSGALSNHGHTRVGLLGIADSAGRYSVGYASGTSRGRIAGREAAEMARSKTGLSTYPPDIVLVNSTCGKEEEV